MPPLRRHQLAHLNAAGWRDALASDWDAEARACLAHWASHGLPLVVTRQAVPRTAPDQPLTLGLATPACWGRRVLSLQVAPAAIAWFSEFPALTAALGVLPRRSRTALHRLQAGLLRHGVRAHAYGSTGWQCLTGLAYRHERSDLDLWLAVDSPAQADAVAQTLLACSSPVRLDGELVFADGSATAWREWAAWRDGRCAQLLVKHLHGVALQAHPPQPPSLCAPWPCAA
jgi:phosphoribosyl-dephospho-CoA transferase